MLKFFKDTSTHPTRALQVWQILVGKAANRQTLTYGHLADLVGFEGAGVFSEILGHVMHYCLENGLPPLTVLVVNRETGLPGIGLTSTVDLHAEREQVFAYDWFGLYPPTAEELAQAYKNGHKP